MKEMSVNSSLPGVTSFLLVLISIVAGACAPWVQAQTPSPAVQGPPVKKVDTDNFNPPPFDFNDDFYLANGVDPKKLADDGGRFGVFNGVANRLTGPPAGSGQVNWVINDSNTDPDRKNVRILATTGGYKDDTGSPTQFINIIAFLNDQTFFTADNQDPNGVGNVRGIRMEDIAGNFEAYAGLRQIGPGGLFLPECPAKTAFR